MLAEWFEVSDMLGNYTRRMDKYSNAYEDRSDWSLIDYQALLLYQVRNANINSAQGFIYQKSLSDADINYRVWSIIKYVGYNEGLTRLPYLIFERSSSYLY